MRRKLWAALVLTALVGIGLVVWLLRSSIQHQVRVFVRQGDAWGLARWAQRASAYYAQHGTWAGIETVLDPEVGRHARTEHGLDAADRSARHAAVEHRPWIIDLQGRVQYPPGVAAPPTPPDLSLAHPIEVAGQVVGYVLPPMRGPGAPQGLLHQIDRAAWLAFGGAMLVAALLAWWLSQRLLRPIATLTAMTQRLAQGEWTVRVPEEGDEELKALARAFNQMAQALQQAQAQQRRLVADIAHELRTPLAVQQAHLEALQDGIYDLTPENLTPAVDQNRLLIRLVNDLRTLSLADSGQLALQPEPILLQDWLPRIREGFQAAARQQAIAITVDLPPEPLWVLADATRLEQILHNLVGNALRYTPPHGRIEIGARAENGQIRLWVHDSGPGLPTKDLERVFERFYRVDPSRNRASGGSGLGLSIARSLARAQGGDLTAANHPQGGALFILKLPRMTGPSSLDAPYQPHHHHGHTPQQQQGDPSPQE